MGCVDELGLTGSAHPTMFSNHSDNWYKYQYYDPWNPKSDDFGYVHFESADALDEYVYNLLDFYGYDMRDPKDREEIREILKERKEEVKSIV